MIVDTHLHVIDPSVLRYPWLAGVPALDRPWSYDTYALANGTGHAVVKQAQEPARQSGGWRHRSLPAGRPWFCGIP